MKPTIEIHREAAEAASNSPATLEALRIFFSSQMVLGDVTLFLDRLNSIMVSEQLALYRQDDYADSVGPDDEADAHESNAVG